MYTMSGLPFNLLRTNNIFNIIPSLDLLFTTVEKLDSEPSRTLEW